MTLQESLADAKVRRAVIIDKISMRQAQEIEAQAVILRFALIGILVGFVIVGISIKVRRNGI